MTWRPHPIPAPRTPTRPQPTNPPTHTFPTANHQPQGGPRGTGADMGDDLEAKRAVLRDKLAQKFKQDILNS